MNKIHIQEDLSGLRAVIGDRGDVFVIIDKNLREFYPYFAGFQLIELETSERNKTLETVAMLVNELLERGTDRNALIIGVGGGITTDIVGFTASVYKRGVKFAFVPTTLLSQVDASIGGKNGVNFHAYKNMIGTITQPQWIYMCPEVLRTLHPRELRAGAAEALKTFVLFDPHCYRLAVDYFAELEEQLQKSGSYLLNGKFYGEERLMELIGCCARYKCEVVERDEFEKGERRMLNLGHTFAHAIEKVCVSTGIMHGEAVAIGMALAAKVALKMGMTDSDFVEELTADLKRTGLPVEIPIDPQSGKPTEMRILVEALKKDKKVDGDHIHFILPCALGDVKDVNVPLNKLEEIAGDLR